MMRIFNLNFNEFFFFTGKLFFFHWENLAGKKLVYFGNPLSATSCFLFAFRTKDNKTPLQLAIQCHLQPVVNALCQKGADLNTCDEKNNCPLWVALKGGQQDIASTLVRFMMFL